MTNNNDVLRNIEYLREKADVSYEEAADLLEQFDGNVMRVLVELERQGRVFEQAHGGYVPPQRNAGGGQQKSAGAKRQASGAISKALSYRLVVENGNGEGKQVIANVSAPYAAGAAIIAPHLAVASVALMFVLGYKVRVKKQKVGPMPQDVEQFVDQTMSNIKKTANSFTETMRGEKPAQNTSAQEAPVRPNDHDDNDEGGEITVE